MEKMWYLRELIPRYMTYHHNNIEPNAPLVSTSEGSGIKSIYGSTSDLVVFNLIRYAHHLHSRNPSSVFATLRSSSCFRRLCIAAFDICCRAAVRSHLSLILSYLLRSPYLSISPLFAAARSLLFLSVLTASLIAGNSFNWPSPWNAEPTPVIGGSTP
ncbi:hypothetical protein AXF42_Ash020394 [Apostasia shenzhenica]|uniref:Uncharacterized protein n=1 Tax=Apostasia shenzhenica TaxID=1088818 RepID=A0A2I0AA51_9ASPA|nr:hypothetical protein AXF42_Ash020394 [Apostasia shenzhenica]